MALALPLVTLFALLIEATSPVMLHLMVEQKMLLQCRDGCFEHFPLCPHLLNLMLMFMNYFAIGKTKLSSHLIEVFGLKSLTNYARILWRNVSVKLYQVQVVQAGGGPQGPSDHWSIWAEKCCTALKQPLSQVSKHHVLLIFNGGDHGRGANGASPSPLT